jgi:NAD(P)-dependent dehydrogenase (short-subunit alcohol dehydrogenase family)
VLLVDKIAIITGGARGIGKGIALKFAEQGCTPVIVDLLESQAAETLNEVNIQGRDSIFIKCDVSDRNQVREMVDQAVGKFGKIDILVNNAGIPGGTPRSIAEISEDDWDRVLTTNLKGTFLCSKAVVPHMKEKKYGRIINISSMAAISPPAPLIHYSSAKAGMIGFTLDLALELAPFNICVNVILPGAIQTDIFDHLVPSGLDKQLFFKEMGKTICPMGRIGAPEDVAGAALFLASDLSSYVTGDRILVGGGAPLVNRIKV